MKRPRFWVVLLGALPCIAILGVAYVQLRGAEGKFDDSFDANIMLSQPLIGRIVEA